MTETTSRFNIAYPSERAINWFADFSSAMAQLDANDFASWADRNKVVFDGGTLTWNGPTNPTDTNELTWTETIYFADPTFGVIQELAPQSEVVINPGEFLVVDLARGPTTVNTVTYSTTSSVPISNHTSVLAWHDPNTGTLYLGTGVFLSDGSSVVGVSPGTNGGSFATVNAEYLLLSSEPSLPNPR